MKKSFTAKRVFVAALLILFTLPAFAQNGKKGLSGKIVNNETGEPIPGAAIYFPDLKTGTVSDMDGNYTITNLPSKKILLQVTMVGYKAILESVDLSIITTKDFQLSEAVKEINEVIVTGTSSSVERNKTATPVTIINKSILVENYSTNIIDALAKQPGISQITTGNGISKPVIRGLGYNRVVVVNDGIRQEGQQWGDEHGIEIDENSVYKIEILKGPASLSYGSDAIAGVINVISAPTLPEGKISGSINTGYTTYNNSLSGSLNLAGNKKGTIFDLRYSNKQFYDYKNPFDGNVYNSRFKENAFTAITGINRSWGYIHLHLSAYNFSPGIVEGERDSATGEFIKQVLINDTTVTEEIVKPSDSESAEPVIPYQDVNHLKAVLNSSVIIKNGTLKSILGFQQNNRKEYAETLSPDEYGLYFLLNTINYEFRYIFPEVKNYTISAGVNGMLQNSKNKGTEFLVPEYDLFDFGVFSIARKSIGKLDVSGGLRYDLRKINSSDLYVDDDGLPVAESSPGSIKRFTSFDKLYSGFSGSLGATYQFSEILFGKANFSAGFRSPNIAESGSNGIHEGTFRYEIGNSALPAERSYQFDLAFGVNTNHVTAELDLFTNTIDNYIFLSALNNSTGGDSLIDGNTVFKYINGQAQLSGGEFLLDIHPHPFDWLHFENSISYVIATQDNQTDSTKYLPFIPAPKISTEIKVSSRKLFSVLSNCYFKIGVLNYLQQDNIYSAFGTETATPAYTLIQAGAGTEFVFGNDYKLSLNVTVNNLGDVAYQDHLSRLKYAPENYATGRSGVFNEGRSVNFKLGLSF